MRELKKGSLGMLLLHLLRERPSYGYELCVRLQARSGGTLSFDEGAIYPLLHEYERQGLVAGYWEGVDGETPLDGNELTDGAPAMLRKGPRRRYYRVTERGNQALGTNVAEWHAFVTAVGRILAGGDGVLDLHVSG